MSSRLRANSARAWVWSGSPEHREVYGGEVVRADRLDAWQEIGRSSIPGTTVFARIAGPFEATRLSLTVGQAQHAA